MRRTAATAVKALGGWRSFALVALLGLAIAGRLVERHGGSLWATSVLGEGSVFHLLLPAAVE